MPKTKNYKTSILSWLRVFVLISILISGCGQVQQLDIEDCDIQETNLDSLFSIGDSVLAGFYIREAEQRLYTDELAEKLNHKQIQEQRERRIYRDTIIYLKEFRTLYTTLTDTIRDTIYVTDTIRDTVYVKRKKKRRKKVRSKSHIRKKANKKCSTDGNKRYNTSHDQEGLCGV